MLIFVGATYDELGLSPEDMQTRMNAWFEWNNKMSEAGVVKSGEALTPEVTRISGPDRITTDRVNMESKELVGGYYIVKAKNLDEAKVIAQDYPDYDLGGTVEIREVIVFNR